MKKGVPDKTEGMCKSVGYGYKNEGYVYKRVGFS